MSSTTFSAELRPDARLRRLVLASALALGVAGILPIAGLDIASPGRFLLMAAWLAVFGWRWQSFRRAYMQNGILRVDGEGRVRCLCRDGSWATLEILPGSVVTAGWAWLRLAPGRGPAYAELLRGDSRRNEDWRRFQVIWRHIGAVP